jgi:hypothetical protein
VTIEATATLIATGVTPVPVYLTTESVILLDGLSVVVKNLNATAAIDLGGSAVASGAGYSLAAGESVSLGPLSTGDDLYGITASSTVVVSVLAVS